MKTEKTYRAINLKPWEVRAILAGTLTELRRVSKHEEPGAATWPDNRLRGPKGSRAFEKHGLWSDKERDYWANTFSPFGNAGDILWGRETWQPHSETEKMHGDHTVDGIIRYKADQTFAPFIYSIAQWHAVTDDEDYKIDRWRPSQQMPREFCRIFLGVKRQRVEQVQDITEARAKAGCVDWVADGCSPYGIKGIAKSWGSTAKHAFCHRWDADNKKPKYKWAANPHVIVAEVGRVRDKNYNDS